MKVAAAVIVVLAVAIAVVPMFTDCSSAGRLLTLDNGRQIPMKCHWTGRAELGLAIPVLGVGLTLGFTRRRETYRNLGFLGVALGVVAILLPTSLIGVCGNPDMPCNSTMSPALIFSGALIIGTSLAVVIRNWRAEPEMA